MEKQMTRTRYEILVDEINMNTFDPKSREDSNKRYVIPPQQRFPGWRLHKKIDLIDSIDRNFEIPAIMLTQRGGNETQSYIQDGQTRLVTIWEYKNNEFTNQHGQYYKDLTEMQRYKFNQYRLMVSKTIFDGYAIEEIKNVEAEMFSKLNAGQPLTNNEKFHSQKHKYVLEYVYDFAKKEDVKKYFGKIGEGKTFSQLDNIVGAVLTIGLGNKDRCTTSYDLNCSYLDYIDIVKVGTFFEEYFEVLSRVVTGKHKKQYGKLSGILSLAIYNYLENGSWKVIEWLLTKLQDDDKYLRTICLTLNAGDQRNLSRSAIIARLGIVQSTYNGTSTNISHTMDNNTNTDTDTDTDTDSDRD